MTTEPTPPAPDGKDWTWVLSAPCPACGFDAAAITGADVADVIDDCTGRFAAALAHPNAAVRTDPAVWSVLEYGCHVRDVCRIFDERVHLMLDEDDPRFVNWDQDETAVTERYWAQDPATVSAELVAAGAHAAATFRAVRREQWSRPGRRSNGSVFTVDSLGRYFAHDLVHHVHDVGA
ncbi:MAG: DinB family protein [Actinomycetota bacterium]|nr:DinB family protein [Actinomycetota bacterium]